MGFDRVADFHFNLLQQPSKSIVLKSMETKRRTSDLVLMENEFFFQ